MRLAHAGGMLGRSLTFTYQPNKLDLGWGVAVALMRQRIVVKPLAESPSAIRTP